MPRTERPEMAGYGVPEDLHGVLDWEWAAERLARSRNYWVATASADGRPHAMPVWGVWLPDEEAFVFSCARTARKARNLRTNPHVVVMADDTVEVVVLEGFAAERSSDEESQALRAYGDKYASADLGADELVAFLQGTSVFRVTPERAFGIIERPDDFARRATRWTWP